jgi:molybdopterin adenylyltransferase
LLKKLRFAVLTISDRSHNGLREDLSGPLITENVLKSGWDVVKAEILPDDEHLIAETLAAICDESAVDVILTTGGTGFSPRDVTPEATKKVIERETPGISEAMRAASLKITPHAMLSRAAAGIRGNVLIINLPGSPKAAAENFEVIRPVLRHAVELLTNDPHAEQGHLRVE